MHRIPQLMRFTSKRNVCSIRFLNCNVNKKISNFSLGTGDVTRKWNNVNESSFKLYSQIAGEETLVDSITFERVCEETLESLTEYFEELVESVDKLESADVSYSSGVLTVNLGPKYGTYVINRQSPNRQIWLSSPISGPKRYDFVVNDDCWIYRHDSKTLHSLLQLEISKIVDKVDFSNCSYSKL